MSTNSPALSSLAFEPSGRLQFELFYDFYLNRKAQTPTISGRNPRNVAIHEAGHAAIDWFLGNSELIRKIDMRGNTSCAAGVHRFSDISPFMLKTMPKPFAEYVAIHEIMCVLAGPAAEFKFLNFAWNTNSEWLRFLFNEWIIVDNFCSDSDLGQAFAIADAIFPEQTEGLDFLAKVAQWTYEALEILGVWNAIGALASQLETQKTMNGRSAARTLQNAGGFQGKPLNDFGQTWLNRCKIQAIPSITWEDIQQVDKSVMQAMRRVAPHLLVRIQS